MEIPPTDPITSKLRLDENNPSTSSTPIAATPTTIIFQLDAEADAELYGQDSEDVNQKPTARSRSPVPVDKLPSPPDAQPSSGGGIPGLFLITDPEADAMTLDDKSVPEIVQSLAKEETGILQTTGLEGPDGDTILTRDDFRFALEPETPQAPGAIRIDTDPEVKTEPKDDGGMQSKLESGTANQKSPEGENSTRKEDGTTAELDTSYVDVDMIVPDVTQAVKKEALDSVIIKEEHEVSKDPVNPGFRAAGEANKDSQDAEWQLDSSDEDSSDEDSDDSDSSEAASDDDYPMMGREELAKLLMEEGGEDEDGDRKEGFQGPLKTKNEIPEEAMKIERPNTVVTEDMKIEILGAVESIVGTMVLIKAFVSGDHQVLNEGSLLVFEDRSILGVVADTFGRVEEPLYTVRFNTPDEIEDTGVKFGQNIYYVPDHSVYVFTQALKAIKGSDASNIFDEEVGEAEREFSDDEAEAEAKRARKRQASGGNRGRNERRGGSIQQPTIRETDEPYVPLARPANLQELLSQPPPPMNSSGGRGDRGHHRGGRNDRGGRGRGRGGQRAGIRGGKGNHGGGDFRRQDGDYGRNGRERDEGDPPSEYQPHSQNYGQQPQDNHPSYSPQPYNPYQQNQYQQQQSQPQLQSQQFMQPYQQQQQPQQQQWGPPPNLPQFPQFPGYPPQTQQPPYQHYPPQQQNLYPGTLPQGSHVNPAFFRNQQQQQPMPSPPANNNFSWTPPTPQQQMLFAGNPTVQQQAPSQAPPVSNEAALKALQNLLSLSKAAQGQK